jgi:hypothetical protein
MCNRTHCIDSFWNYLIFSCRKCVGADVLQNRFHHALFPDVVTIDKTLAALDEASKVVEEIFPIGGEFY